MSDPAPINHGNDAGFDDGGPLSLRSLRETGFLQEANRLFFHPLGLSMTALSAGLTDRNGTPILTLRVCRRDAASPPLDETPERANRAELVQATAAAVAKRAGPMPPPYHSDMRDFDLDPESITTILRNLVAPFITSLLTQGVAIADPTGASLDALARPVTVGAAVTLGQSIAQSAADAFAAGVLAPMVAAMRVTPGIRPRVAIDLAALEPHVPTPTPDADGMDTVKRTVAYLRSRLECTADLHARHGQLLSDEVVRLGELTTTVDGWWAAIVYGPDESLTVAPTPDQLADATLHAEDLYGRAQPGMLYFKGDADAMAKWRAVSRGLRAEVTACMAAQTETARFLAGRVAAHDLADAVAVTAEIEARAGPLRDQLAQLQDESDALATESAQLRISLAPLEAALDRMAVVP